MTRNSYFDRGSYAELVAVILAGAAHIVLELKFSEGIALVFSAAIAGAFGAYLIWRALRTPGTLRLWGLRRDNFWPALRAQMIFGLSGAIALLGVAAASGAPVLPGTFWMTLALYPIWGTAQQFALQNLIAKNLSGLLSKPLAIAATASLLFALSHYPRFDLMLLTGVAGVFFTLIYRRIPNLWAVGIVHGLLGSLAVYLIAGEDPGAAILSLLSALR